MGIAEQITEGSQVTPAAPVAGVAGAAGELGPDRYVSLRQPWASLWVAGAKLIETRSWPTKHRGRLAVHASKTFGRDEFEACYREPFRRALAALGFDQPIDLPRGAVIGWVTISDCLEMTGRLPSEGLAKMFFQLEGDPRLTDIERAFGAYEPGRFAWVTNRHRLVLPAPIPMKALQRIQKLPPEIVATFERYLAVPDHKVITDWSLVPDPRDAFKAPEARDLCLCGLIVGGNARRGRVVTSPIVQARGRIVSTASGSTYRVLDISANYRAFLDADGMPPFDPENPLASRVAREIGR